jgi:hypothetical protein
MYHPSEPYKRGILVHRTTKRPNRSCISWSSISLLLMFIQSIWTSVNRNHVVGCSSLGTRRELKHEQLAPQQRFLLATTGPQASHASQSSPNGPAASVDDQHQPSKKEIKKFPSHSQSHSQSEQHWRQATRHWLLATGLFVFRTRMPSSRNISTHQSLHHSK